MHLYNAWLPPPVAEESKREKESFAQVVQSVKNSYRPDDTDSVYSTLKWASVIDLFVPLFSSYIIFPYLITVSELQFVLFPLSWSNFDL